LNFIMNALKLTAYSMAAYGVAFTIVFSIKDIGVKLRSQGFNINIFTEGLMIPIGLILLVVVIGKVLEYLHKTWYNITKFNKDVRVFKLCCNHTDKELFKYTEQHSDSIVSLVSRVDKISEEQLYRELECAEVGTSIITGNIKIKVDKIKGRDY